jgi:tetratricopeptide (TPR) repeat protein
VIDVVQALVDKSLLRAIHAPVVSGASHRRFDMLAILNEYARARLEEQERQAGDDHDRRAPRAVEERHGRWYARYGDEAVLETLNGRGGVDQRLWEPDLDNLIAACRSAVSRGDGPTAAHVYRALGMLFRRTGPFTSAIELGDAVGRVTSGCGERALVLETMAFLLVASGRAVEARARCEEALELQRGLGHRRRAAYLTGLLGYINVTLGRLDEASSACRAALAMHRAHGSRKGEALALSHLGTFHQVRGETRRSSAYEQAALAVSLDIGDRPIEAAVRCNMGTTCARLGRLAEGRGHCEAAIAISRELGDRRIEGIALDSLACVEIMALDHHGARMHGHDTTRLTLESALAIHRETGNRQREGAVLCNLGMLAHRHGRMEEARASGASTIAMLRAAGDARSLCIALANLAALDRDQGRLIDATARGREVLAISRSLGNQAFMGESLDLLATVALAGADINQACSWAESALMTLRTAGDRRLEAAALLTRASRGTRTLPRRTHRPRDRPP